MTGTLNERAARLLVDQLVRQGVRHFSLSPGSRSTPLAIAIAEHPEVSATVHFDERGTGFHALGCSKASGAPTAIVVTSGTAVGNLLPAVMEASHAQIPLILLTADRPPELRDNGSNQVADQVKIFGSYVRWYAELPCPTSEITDAYLGTTVAQAVFRSLNSPKGPVHLNCMFREPLSAEAAPEKILMSSTHYEQVEPVPSSKTLKSWAELLSVEERGLILCGELNSHEELASINELAEKLGWPIFGDILSGLRSEKQSDNFIRYYDLTLKTCNDLKLNTLLHFGGRPVSKTLAEWIGSCKPKHYFYVADHPFRHDPKHQVTHRLFSNPVRFSELLLPHLKSSRDKNEWLESLKSLSHHIAGELPKIFSEFSSLTEPGLAHYLAGNLSPDWALFISNSMPVRDADLFLFPQEKIGPIFANRGLSGIDGNIATAVGIAQGAKRPTLALLGDLAFLHDLNSLALVKKSRYPVALMLINNGGGAIFSFLPVTGRKNQKENLMGEFFAAEHSLTFEKAAELFDLPYYKVEAPEDLEKALKTEGSCLIEMCTDRAENYSLHQEITRHLCSSLLSAVQ
ncbi:MAG: 2-succinyl-5-enolpyruvyl-6-hydroxy-3-cyclohexene-1-carboxylic-acid synthase [Chlamydiales bacterium]|nr:2-succinyl-5-enolpyruvyl-6-hydroxy-3-cyclohexene-1-carboxylic-acid synthase [Chlamydiales bacterium]